jgi:alpha-galactosidase
LSEAAHEAGMQFCLWFEPERVARESQIGREHAEFCLDRGQGDLLFDLGRPEAREFMIDLLSQAIAEHGVDIYREDFNIDPLAFWRSADEAEREGMSEIRFVEGLYAMWDELVARRPGLVIDNCASGGRRIDLETASRSYALWRSDFQDVGILARPNHLGEAAIANQVQMAGLAQYVPFSTGALWAFDPYSVRSAMSAGAPAYMDLRAADLNRDQARAGIAEVKALRKFFLGDLYPLLPITTSAADWHAYQLDRPDLGEGIALYFRRHRSPYLSVQANLRALDPGAKYEYSLSPDYAEGQPQETTGAELPAIPIAIDQAPGCVLLRYSRL